MRNEYSEVDERPEAVALLARIKAAMPSLRALFERCSGEWGYEDPIYRFYHQSMKVYGLQQSTESIVQALQQLSPNTKLNPWFLHIVKAGTGREFGMEDNARWLRVTRPILEAFFHARYFLEVAVKYGATLKRPPNCLPSGWAALLYLYNMRTNQ